MHTFRCKNCGHLELDSNIGLCNVPQACSVCNHGVSFDQKTGAKTAIPSNWEVLGNKAVTQQSNDVIGRHIQINVFDCAGTKNN